MALLPTILLLIAYSNSWRSLLGVCQAAAIQGLIPFGPAAGTPTGSCATDPPPGAGVRKKLCASVRGFSLHAAVRVGAGQRERLERLCRYVTRPPLAQDRLSVTEDGKIVYRFRRPWRNGTSAVVLDPMTFLSRLAAQIPPPRFHMLSYYGVLAPAAGKRHRIVPSGGCWSRWFAFCAVAVVAKRNVAAPVAARR